MDKVWREIGGITSKSIEKRGWIWYPVNKEAEWSSSAKKGRVFIMGTYFSNLHLRMKRDVAAEGVAEVVTGYFVGRGCVPATEDTADMTVSVFAPKSGGWLSVCSESFSYEDVLALAPGMAEQFQTDVLSVACFDSDYLFLNLVNVIEGVDAWLNIGTSCEIKAPRRSTLARWKPKVADFEAFQAAAKEKHVFAEEFLTTVEAQIGLPAEQSVNPSEKEQFSRLCFAVPAEQKPVATKLKCYLPSLMPPQPGKMQADFVYNEGSASQGLMVMFVGSYVEHDEITIDDATFCHANPDGTISATPISFEKKPLSNGQWAYVWSDPDFRIPPLVPKGLPPKVAQEKQHDRIFGIRYTPNGNKRKFLDITTMFVPMENREKGYCAWCVWWSRGSKLAYIQEHNNTWSNFKWSKAALLNPEDYDLD